MELTVNAQEQIIRINRISDDINEILYRGGIKVSMFQVGAFAESRDADEMTRSLRFRRAHRDSLLAEVSRSRFGQRPALKYSLDSLLIACRKLDLLFESVELHFERGQPGRAERAFSQLHGRGRRLPGDDESAGTRAGDAKRSRAASVRAF